jgi:hypothetical protein
MTANHAGKEYLLSLFKPKMVASYVIAICAICIDSYHHEYIPKTNVPVDYVYPYARKIKPIPDIHVLQDPVCIGICCVILAFFYPRIHIVHGIMRFIRVVCIYVTSLPNPHPYCVQRRSRCNDLLPSGHVGTIVSMAVGADNPVLSALMTGWAVLQSHQAVYNRHHYTVDVVLAFVLPFLINKWVLHWHWLPDGIHHQLRRIMRGRKPSLPPCNPSIRSEQTNNSSCKKAN